MKISMKYDKYLRLTVDPIIAIQCFGKTKYSKILKNRGKSKIVWVISK